MRNTNFLTIMLILLAFWSCGSDNNTTEKQDNHKPTVSNHSTYSKHGISFSKPEGWHQAESPIPGEAGKTLGAYIIIEKEGEDESGQFIASLLDTKVPLVDYMDLVQNQLLESLNLQKTEISFSKIIEEDFNGAKALVCTFKHNTLDLDFRGELKAFYCGDKTVQIFIQEEEGDASKNKAGLEMLKKTFSCI